MHGEMSLAADHEVRERFAPVLKAAGASAGKVSDELFGFSSVLEANGKLERALTDPSRPASDKQKLLRVIVAGKVQPVTLEILDALVACQWSRVYDISNGVEDLAIDAILYQADAEGKTSTVAMELAKIHSAVLNLTAVRSYLSDTYTSAGKRVECLRTLLRGNSLDPITMKLAEHSTRDLRNRRFLSTLSWLINKISEHSGEEVVTVTSAVPLSAEQTERITNLYTLKLDHPVHINSVVDETVIGGLRIQVGAEVTDTTVVAQLHHLQQVL